MKRTSRAILLGLALSVAAGPLHAEIQKPPAAKSAKQRTMRAEREMTLGALKLGDRETEVRKKLRPLRYGDQDTVYINEHWTVWIDEKNKAVKGLSFEERSGILQNQPYPKTSAGISLGSTPAEVEKTYGTPEQALMGKAPFVLRTSELAIISVYPSAGLWIMFTNQAPYSASPDWRATLICIGNNEVIESMRAASSEFAMPLTPIAEQKRIAALYKKNFGKNNAADLGIFDDYQFIRQAAIAARVRAAGSYAITPAMIIPQNERKAKALVADLSPASPFMKELDRLARRRTSEKYRIPENELDRIIANMGGLDVILAKEASAQKTAAQKPAGKLLAGQPK